MQEDVRELLGGTRRWWLRPRVLGPLVFGLLALVVAAGMGPGAPATQSIAFPLPSPTYSIVGHSGTHQISLLNLPVPYVGLPQVPIPVDVNGDLLPDVTVSLNLINVPEGLLHNPPQFDDLIAPNLEINRLVTAPLLGQTSPPLRLEIRYRISDLEGGPETVIQAGYDTGPGGSIPTYWKAILGGLSDMFNPLSVRLDTRPPLPNQYEQPTYRGPLSIVGQVELEGSMELDFDLHYDPLPDDIFVSLGTDDEGTHVLYNHNAPREVDVNTHIHQLAADGSMLEVEARVDRMPTEIAVDFASGEGVGDLAYQAEFEGRAPDLGAHIVSTPAPDSDDSPLVLQAEIESLPSELTAHWELPADGDMAFEFDTPTSGVGAIEAEIRDYFGSDPADFAFIPTEQQFASYHQQGDQSLIRARAERIRSVSFDQIADGIDASMQVGDGQMPFEVQFLTDDFNHEGTTVDAHAIVSPLPSEIDFSFRTPQPGSVGEPLTVTYGTGESGETADVDAEVRVVEPETSPQACGDPGVLCAELDVRHLPAQITATIVNVTALDSRINIDMVPRPGAAEPDIFANAIIAQKPEPPDPGDPPPLPPDPIVADVGIFGLPEHLRIRLERRIAGEGTVTEQQVFERAEFHACDWDYEADPPACDGDEGRVEAIEFAFRNFLTGEPLPPLVTDTPLWVTVVGRGGALPTDSVRIEAEGYISDVAEVQLITNDDIFGLRTDVGGNQNLSAQIDVDNVPIVIEEATETDPAVYHRIDLEASATVLPLPQHLDFCLQRKDRAVIEPPSTPYTAVCQDADPFGDDDGVGNATRTPLALAYVGTDAAGDPQEFDVKTSAHLNERGVADPGPDVIDDDQHIRGRVDVDNLPGSFSAFVDSPPDDEDGNPTEGPLRVEYDANAPIGAEQVKVDFAVEATDADFLCKDPRPMPLGKSALCAKAIIDNLPTEVSLFYDPDLAANNLSLDTSGTELIDIDGLEASLVEGKLVDKNDPPTPDDESDDTLETAVLLAFGFLHDLPEDLTGTMLLPGTIDVTASPPIGSVELTVQNFIGPDPLPDGPPGDRADAPAPANQLFTVFQRDTFFRAFARVSNLRGFAFATSRDAENPDKLLDTKTIRVAFGSPGQILRAYADLQFFAEHNPDGSPVPTSLASIIGDVTLSDVPEEVTLCIRGKKTIAGTPLDPNFCDEAPASDDEGAFSFVGAPPDPVAGPFLDIDAFVRFAKGGGTDVLAARVQVDDIPHVVQGRFRTEGGARFQFNAYDTLTPNGFGDDVGHIGSVHFDFADFDIDTHGYPTGPGTTPPWGAQSRSGTVAPFPDVLPAGQFVRLHLNAADMHVGGELHDLESVLFGEEPCEAPSSPAPDSYPYYPIGLGEEYTCIRAEFANEAEELLDIHLDIEKDGEKILLHDAGLTRMPNLIQATIAKAEEENPDTSWRIPCPDITPHPGDISCMPPLLRVDTSGDATLFGEFEMGKPEHLAVVRDYDARGTLVNLDELSTAWTQWGPDPRGARLRVVMFGKGTPGEDPVAKADDGTAITASLRIDIPESITVDQIQKFSSVTDADGDGRVDDTTDIRLRVAVREDSGGAPGGPDQTVDFIGQLSALIHDKDKGDQILASGLNEVDGLQIPGELGLTLFLRQHKVEDAQGCDDNPVCHDITYIQVEGRISESIDARVRVDGGAGASVQDIGANIKNLPDTDGVPDDEPSFMLRAEMDKNVGEPTDGLEEALLCIVYCIQTDIGIERLDASIDFDPPDGDGPVRRVDAYIVMDSADNAIELRGYENFDDPLGSDGNQPIDADVHIGIDPMTVFLHFGLNPIAGMDLFLHGELRVDAVIDAAEEFRINNSILHLVLEQERGDPSSATNGSHVDVNLHVYSLVAASFLWLFFIPPIPLYVATFLPPSLPPPAGPPLGSALLQVTPCPGSDWGGAFIDNSIAIESTENLDLSAWFNVLLEFRYIRFGLLAPLVDFLVPLIFCAVGADKPLMDDEPGKHPGPSYEIETHPITGLPDDYEPAPPEVDPPPPPPELVVSNGQTLALCGAPAISKVTVEPGGVLEVANVVDLTPIPFVDADSPPQPRCPQGPPGEENSLTGSLTLNAGQMIDVSGTIEGPAAPGTLAITADEILIDDNGPDPNGLVQAGTGHVTLQSAGLIDIQGDVRADELISAPAPALSGPASGGGGAGHGGAGGNIGPGGGAGGAYGDLSFTPVEDADGESPFPPNLGQVPLETGAIGSTPGVGTAGLGGGTIYIQGTTIDVAPTGTVSANGGPGSDNHADNEHCAVNVHYPDDPDQPGDQSHTDLFANTGLVGSGGGSGGAIFLGGTKVIIDGTVEAVGGQGGAGIAGGGGGGGGGIIKVSAALLFGSRDASGGAGGSSECPDNPTPAFFPADGNGIEADDVTDASARPEFPPGEDGHALDPQPELIGPHSSATPLDTFFKRAEPGALLSVPYVAAAALQASPGHEIVLCGLSRPVESFLPAEDDSGDDPNDDKDPNDIDMAAGQTDLAPCGTSAPDDDPNGDSPTSGPHLLASATFSGTEAPADAAFNVALDNGYWSLYTVLLRNAGNPANSCLDHGDFLLLGSGHLYDTVNCSVEPLPDHPDTVGDIAVGIDNADPFVEITAPAVSEGATVPVVIENVRDDMPAPGYDPDPIENFTGVVAIDCSADLVTWTECGLGTHAISFSGSGSHNAHVRVTDLAGNQFIATSTQITVDAIAPTSDAEYFSGPPPAGGWFSTGPVMRIFGFADNADGSGPRDDGVRYEWWIDDGSPTQCPSGVECFVDLGPVLNTGQHVFHWRAIDKAGNQEDGDDPGNVLPVNVDGELPEVELLAVPDEPANTPIIPDGGSNGWYTRPPFVVISAIDQLGASGITGVFYGIDDPSAPLPYTGFFTVPAGDHIVYFRAVDGAGNATVIEPFPSCSEPPPNPGDPEISCRRFLVDDAPPVTNIVNDPPNGDNGWHTSAVPVTIETTDAVPGSTVDPLVAGSGTFVSVDGAPRQLYTGPITIGEGHHSIVTWSRDVSGQRSAVMEREYFVDLSPPRSVLRESPPLPARNNWWRSLPANVLRATDGDQNAGVESVVFRRNGGTFDEYTGRFGVNPGSTLIEWQALDRSGPDNDEPVRSRTVLADPSPPTAAALNGPLLYIRSQLLHILLGVPLNAPLNWRVSDSVSGRITVTIKIYNVLGQVVRTIEHGTVNVTPGVPLTGSTPWDGRDLTLTGLVPAGVYYYRVIATDDAGNVAQSGESKPITITIKLL